MADNASKLRFLELEWEYDRHRPGQLVLQPEQHTLCCRWNSVLLQHRPHLSNPFDLSMIIHTAVDNSTSAQLFGS